MMVTFVNVTCKKGTEEDFALASLSNASNSVEVGVPRDAPDTMTLQLGAPSHQPKPPPLALLHTTP